MEPHDRATFSDTLLNVDSSDPELRRGYEAAKLALLERRLSPWQRRLGWLGLPVYILLAGSGGYRLVIATKALPREWVLLDAAGVLGVLALGIWALRVLLRGGRVTWRDDRAVEWIGGLGLGGLLVALFVIAESMDDANVGRRLEICGFLLLFIAGLSALLDRIRRLKLETRVQLLELELRLAGLAQAVEEASRLGDGPRP